MPSSTLAARLLVAQRQFDALFMEALGLEPEDSAQEPAALPTAFWNLDQAGVLAASAPSPQATPSAAPQPAAPQSAAATGKEPFLDRLRGVAQDTAEALALPADFLLAHAALESGWGKRAILNADGSDSHNLFGIKAGKGWTGKTTEIRTTEYVGGVPQSRVDTFRSYDSFEQAFADYAALLKSRFSAALGQGSAEAFGQALQAGGYATDPGYATKLAAVIRSVATKLG